MTDYGNFSSEDQGPAEFSKAFLVQVWLHVATGEIRLVAQGARPVLRSCDGVLLDEDTGTEIYPWKHIGEAALFRSEAEGEPGPWTPDPVFDSMGPSDEPPPTPEDPELYVWPSCPFCAAGQCVGHPEPGV